MKSEAFHSQIGDALRNREPDSDLDRVVDKWKDRSIVVKENGRWKLSGLIQIFEQAHEILCAVHPATDPTLPPQCYDPVSLADFFNIPRKELVRGADKRRSGRPRDTQDIADYADARRPDQTWDQIYVEWKRDYPDCTRVKSSETVREAWRREYGDKKRLRAR